MRVPELEEAMSDQEQWYQSGAMELIEKDPTLKQELERAEKMIESIEAERQGKLLAEERGPLDMAMKGACSRYRAIVYRASQILAPPPPPGYNAMENPAVRTVLLVLGGTLLACQAA